MKYEFTGTVKDNEPLEYNIVIAVSILVISVYLILIQSVQLSPNNNISPITIITIGIIIGLISYWYIMNHYKNKNRDEKSLHGEIYKIRLHDKYIEIVGKKEKIGWDSVLFIKEHWYLERYERSSKEIQIIYDLGKGKRRIYLIETPDIGSSKSRYVNTQVDKKKYDEVLEFLKTKAKFVGKTIIDI